MRLWLGLGAAVMASVGTIAALAMLGCTPAAAGQAYPSMAGIAQYRMAAAEEAALARSAAPPSISDKATVLVLGERGYETAAAGTNGFICMVQRAWANDFDSAEFWNPKVRAPICFNAAAGTLVKAYLQRTEWVIAGLSREEVGRRTHAAFGALSPDVGAMCFMMSKGGYLDDAAAGPWRPHLMYYLPPTEPGAWGANLPGSPVIGGGVARVGERASVFITPVPRWSDGTLDEALGGPGHKH